MNREVTTAIVLDKRTKRKRDNRHTVRLRVTYQRQQRYYSTKYVLTEEEFKKVMSPDSRGRNKTMRLTLNLIEKRAIEYIDRLPDFSFELFEYYLKSPKGKPTINSVYESYIKQFKKEGRIGTAQGYQTSYNSLLKFRGKEIIYFSEIDKSFLYKFENWMLKSGKSMTTVGFYLRSLRAIFNQAISKRMISEILYPFGKNKYQIPESKNPKRAIKHHKIKELYFYPTVEMSPEDLAKDIWFFSYLCNYR